MLYIFRYFYYMCRGLYQEHENDERLSRYINKTSDSVQDTYMRLRQNVHKYNH